MSTLRIEESQARLPDLLDQLKVVDEIVILRNAVPLGKLTRMESQRPHPVAGRGKGRLVIVADDDEHLRGFEN
jgi:hypothetical protein